MPFEKPSRRTVVLVVGVLAIAGGALAVGLLTGGQADPAVGHNASERYAELDGMTATVVTTVERGSDRNRTVREVAMRPAAGQVRLAPTGNAAANGTVVVANGSTKWTYDPGTNLVNRADAGGLSERLRTRGTRIERLFERAVGAEGAGTTSDERTPGVAPLPVVPQGHDTPAAPTPNRSGDQFTVDYDGTGTVAGREVHVLHVRPREGAESTVTQTLWVDAEWFVPLKYVTVWLDEGDPVTTTVEYRDVTFEPGLSDDRFEYEPPETAAVVTPRLGVNAADRIRAIDGLTATLHRQIRGVGSLASNVTADEPVETVQRVRAVPGTGKQRIRVLESYTNESESTDLRVTNGSVSWRYNRETNNVTRLHVASPGQQYERIEQLFARLNRTRTTPDDGDATSPSPGLSPVPGTGSFSGVSTPQLPSGQFGVSLERAAQVDGRTTYVLQIRPRTDGNRSRLQNYTQTLWIDTETFFPLKQHTAFGTDQDRFSITVTYRNLSFTDGFEPGTFTFEPPADANVTVTDPVDGQSYDSPEATVENAPFPATEPTVPPGFEFTSGQTTETRYTKMAILSYRNETSQLFVTASVTNESALPGNVTAANGTETNGTADDTRDSERIQVGNRTVRYSSGLSKSASWDCGEVEYSVSGSFVSKPLLIEVAESMPCPDAG